MLFQDSNEHFGGVQQPVRKILKKMATRCWTVHKMQSFGAPVSALHPQPPRLSPRCPSIPGAPPLPPADSEPGAADAQLRLRPAPGGSSATTLNFRAPSTFPRHRCDYRNAKRSSRAFFFSTTKRVEGKKIRGRGVKPRQHPPLNLFGTEDALPLQKLAHPPQPPRRAAQRAKPAQPSTSLRGCRRGAGSARADLPRGEREGKGREGRERKGGRGTGSRRIAARLRHSRTAGEGRALPEGTPGRGVQQKKRRGGGLKIN